MAYLYWHRMNSYAQKVRRWAKASIRQASEEKNSLWMLSMAEGHTVWDWNMANHREAVDFYRELVEANPKVRLPYLYLMDNLLADRRADEAEAVLAAIPLHNAEWYFLIGMCAYRRGQYSRAYENINRACSMAPDNVEYSRVLYSMRGGEARRSSAGLDKNAYCGFCSAMLAVWILALELAFGDHCPRAQSDAVEHKVRILVRIAVGLNADIGDLPAFFFQVRYHCFFQRIAREISAYQQGLVFYGFHDVASF